MTRAWLALLVVLAGCTKHTNPPFRHSRGEPIPEPTPRSPPLAEEASSAQATPAPLLTTGSVIAARSLGLWYGKPPLKEHRFDVVLQNPARDARWMVLPTSFPYEHDTRPAPGDSPVAELQVYRLSEHPKVVLAEGVGGTFWAVKLPAGGRVTLRRLRIESWWDTVPAEVTLEVLVARSITVGGAPLADLIGEDPLCETGADVLAAKDAGDERALHFWHPDAGYDAPLAMNVESRARVLVPLSHEMY